MTTVFEDLYGEPDIPANIFSNLSEKDLCQVELVCQQWKYIVKDRLLWKKKLEKRYHTDPVWKTMLLQHDWYPNVILEPQIAQIHKSIFMQIRSLLGPDEMTDGILKCITNDIDLTKEATIHQTPVTSIFSFRSNHDATTTPNNLTREEKFFLTRRHNDHVTLMSKMPLPSRGRGLPWQKSGPRKTNLSHDGEHYSNLILFSPTAFPILVTDKGYVAVAGARYGKGKLVVVPHEAVLSHGGLMQGAIDWCTNQRNTTSIFVDPLTKGWRRGWQYMDVRRTRKDPPFPVTFLDRNKLSADIPVYITEGHYEDHADHMMEYVKNGGGLIIGGHAWWWASNDIDVVDRRKCSILEHPGNKIIARAGIAYSREGIQQNKIEFHVDNMPALKHSLYYAHKTCITRPSYVFRQDIYDKLLKGTEYDDIQLFSDQLRGNDYFNVILQYMYEIQTRAF